MLHSQRIGVSSKVSFIYGQPSFLNFRLFRRTKTKNIHIEVIYISNEKRHRPQEGRAQSQRSTYWRWLEHLSTHLGTALAFSVFAAVPLALYVRNIDFFQDFDDRTRFDSAKAFRALLGPYLIIDAAGWVYGFSLRFNKKVVAYYTARIVIPIFLLAYCIVEASAYLFSFDVYWSGLSVFLSIILTPWQLQRRTVDIGLKLKFAIQCQK